MFFIDTQMKKVCTVNDAKLAFRELLCAWVESSDLTRILGHGPLQGKSTTTICMMKKTLEDRKKNRKRELRKENDKHVYTTRPRCVRCAARNA